MTTGTRRAALAGLVLLVACGTTTDPNPQPRQPDDETPGDTLVSPSNTEPQVTAGPSFAYHDEDYDHAVVVVDADGDSVTLQATTLPSWMSFDRETRTLSGVPGEALLGDSGIVTLRASDGTDVVTRSYQVKVVLGTSSLTFSGSWTTATPHIWGHNGDTVRTSHFDLYTGFASRDTVVYVGNVLEGVFSELLDTLGVVDEASELDYSRPSRKIDIFVTKLQGNGTNGWAYRDGFLVLSPDSPRFVTQGYTPARWRRLAKHELTHVMEFLLLGTSVSIVVSDVWFREGIATYFAGTAPGNVDFKSFTDQQLDSWISTHQSLSGGGNPIAVHVWGDFPQSIVTNGQTGSYYSWFALAVQYLVDPAGHGGSHSDLRGIYDDQRAGMTFAESFESRFGMTLADYEANFFDLMRNYLP